MSSPIAPIFFFGATASLTSDYRMSVLALDSGRIITGIIKEESAKTLTVQSANERVLIAKSDIEVRKRSNVSLMPEALP